MATVTAPDTAAGSEVLRTSGLILTEDLLADLLDEAGGYLTDEGAGTPQDTAGAAELVGIVRQLADTGGAADAPAPAAVVLQTADLGGATDAPAVAAVLQAADPGGTADVFAVSAALLNTDTAAAADAWSPAVTVLQVTDPAAAADAITAAVALQLADASGTPGGGQPSDLDEQDGTSLLIQDGTSLTLEGSGGPSDGTADVFAVSAALLNTDTAAAADTESAAAATTGQDLAGSTDAPAETAAAPAGDTAAAGEGISGNVSVLLQDTAAAADLTAYIACSIPLSAVAGAGDGLLSAEFPVYADPAAAAEVLAVAAVLQTTDTAAAADAPAVAAAVPLASTAAAGETLAVNVSQTDLASAADTVTIAAGILAGDAGAAADLEEKTPFTAGGAAAGTATATLDIILDRDIADGDSVVVAWGTDGTQTAAGAADTSGQSWTLYNLNATGRSCGFLTAASVQGMTAGDTITITWSDPAAAAAIICGIPTATMILSTDAAAGTGGTSTTPAESTGPLAYQNEICLGVIAAAGGDGPSGPSWPQLDYQQYIPSGTWVTAYSMIPGATTSPQTCAATIPAGAWGTAVLTFYYEVAQDLAGGADQPPDITAVTSSGDQAGAAESLVMQKAGGEAAGAADTALIAVTSPGDEAAAAADTFSYIVSASATDPAAAAEAATAYASGTADTDLAGAGETVTIASEDTTGQDTAGESDDFAYIAAAVPGGDLAAAADTYAYGVAPPVAADTAAAGTDIRVAAAVAAADLAGNTDDLSGQVRTADVSAAAEALTVLGTGMALGDAGCAGERLRLRIWVFVPVAGAVHGGSVTGPLNP